jgi:hypothetical protein
MKKLTICLFSVACAFLFGTASATILRVPMDYSTIQAAINAANKSDTVLVLHGTYPESIDFLGKAIVVSSLFILDHNTAHIDSTIINPGGVGTGVNCSSGETSSSKLIGFTITGCGGLNEAGIRCYQGSPFISHNRVIGNQCRSLILYQSKTIIQENEIHGNPFFTPTPEDAIFMSQSGPRIEKNIIRAADPNGNINAIYHGTTGPSNEFEIVISKNVIIGRIWGEFFEGGPIHSIDHNLIISGNGFSEAMNITAGDSGLVIINNTIIGGSGIFIQSGTGPHIRNNIIAFADKGIEVWSGIASFAYNDVWQCASPYDGIPDQTGRNGNIAADPRFVDKANQDYHLLPSSPCIDAGDPRSDFSHEPEPNGGRINMGAYGGTEDATRSLPVIIVEPPMTLDFGNVTLDSSAQLSFSIQNVGHSILLVTEIASSNAAFVTNFNPSDSLILPANNLHVLVTFRPTVSTSYGDSLTILNNDRPTVISLRGNGIVTEVKDKRENDAIPEAFALFQNYPNPFNPSTIINYTIPHSGHVMLKVFNLLGEEVASLMDKQLPAGRRQVEWNAGGLASGVYFYRLQAGGFAETKKLILMR